MNTFWSCPAVCSPSLLLKWRRTRAQIIWEIVCAHCLFICWNDCKARVATSSLGSKMPSNRAPKLSNVGNVALKSPTCASVRDILGGLRVTFPRMLWLEKHFSTSFFLSSHLGVCGSQGLHNPSSLSFWFWGGFFFFCLGGGGASLWPKDGGG